MHFKLKIPDHWTSIKLDQAAKWGSGGTQKNISQTVLKQVVFPKPSPAEQHLIIEKIEELFSELDKGIEQLKTAQQQLKVYRQAVLKWAFEDVKKGKIEKNVEDCCLQIVDCLHSTAKFTTNGFFCVDTTCIENNRILIEKVRYVDEKTYLQRISRLKPDSGDILFAREGTVGTTLIVPENIELCLGQRMMMFRLKPNISPKYVNYFFQSNLFRSQYIPLIIGTTAPHLNIRDIKKFKVTITNYEQQMQIVQDIETRLSICDKMEETITAALRQADALRQSILKRTFEGKLI